jgi:phosphotransacetylase
VAPIVVGSERAIRASAEAAGFGLDGFTIVAAEGDAVAGAAVAEVRDGRARMLMKGRISTPALLRAVLDPAAGLRTGRVVCQVVLMEVLAREAAEARRFLLADTGIRIQPTFQQRIDILRSTVEVAQALGVERPRVALMAATETVNPSMPETVQAAELQRRNEAGEFPDCLIQGPLSFDLAYAPSVAGKKQVAGAVVGAADVMLFPNLLSANLTVKAVMYTADCRFGGVLRGTTAPVVFMSRADTPVTRLNSLALGLALLRHERRT